MKTNCRLFGLYQSLIGTGSLVADYYFIFNKIAENDYIVSKIIDYGLGGIVAIGGIILTSDGISDIITGMHHYGSTKIYQILSGDKDKKTEKWIEQMRLSKDQEFPKLTLKDFLKSD